MSNGNSWMPLYIGDYLRDTMGLDAAQHGAYLLLLMYYWSHGPLPLEDTKLAQIARTELRVWRKTVGPIVRLYFTEREGRLHQKRADLELAKSTDISAKRRAAAWSRHHHPNGQDDNPAVHANAGPNAPVLQPVCTPFAEALQPVCTVHSQVHSQVHSSRYIDSEVRKESSLFTTEMRAREAGQQETEEWAREPDPEWAPAARNTTQPLVFSIAKTLRTDAYPPRAPVRDVHDQIDQAGPERTVRPAFLTPAQLAIVRRRQLA